MEQITHDLIIVGGGPAGCAAAVYAARKELKTVFITEAFGGQSIVSPDIHNWIGTPSIPGVELAKNLESHVRKYEDLAVVLGRVKSIEERDGGVLVTTEKGDEFHARKALITTGADRRKLPAAGADKLEHKGLTYCASCDGPFFKGKDTVVIGGGNAGFETAAQLLAYTKSVTLLHRSEKFRADAETVHKVLEHPAMTGLLNIDVLEVLGDTFVSGVRYKDRNSGEEKTIEAQGVFVEIGNVPASGIVENVVELDDYKRIVTDPKTQRTSSENIWAAGDCTDALYHQNNIAAGDAVKAIENIYLALYR